MRRLTGLLAVALLALPLSARAKDGVFDSTADKPYDLQLDGGIGGWLGNVSDVTTNVGPAYGIIGAFNRSNYLSYELGYLGHSNGVDSTDRRLSSNKIQADLKLGIPMTGTVAWKPYLFGGLAVDFVTSSTEAFGLDSSIQGVVPFGVGADFLTDKPIHIGARGTYDWSPGVGGRISPADAHPDAWQAFLQASAAF
jgi:hypothetical protein